MPDRGKVMETTEGPRKMKHLAEDAKRPLRVGGNDHKMVVRDKRA
jgi:hypothetical protein